MVTKVREKRINYYGINKKEKYHEWRFFEYR